jgi:ribosomal 50S subunit-associated protein YjgA (DUF615 family)
MTTLNDSSNNGTNVTTTSLNSGSKVQQSHSLSATVEQRLRRRQRRSISTNGFFREYDSSNDSNTKDADGNDEEYSSSSDVFAENEKGEPVYFGRKNKSALKRDSERTKRLGKDLLAINGKTIRKMTIMDERLRESLLECQRTSSHIAKRRAEQQVAKTLRALNERELKPLEDVVERMKLGIDGGLGAVDPKVDDLAKSWRRRVSGNEGDDAAKVAMEEVFKVMSKTEEEGEFFLGFTRQELVDVARKAELEAKITALESEKFKERQIAEANGDIVFDDDDEFEEGNSAPLKKSSTATAVQNKKKNKGKTAMKTLLKMLRDVAERAEFF